MATHFGVAIGAGRDGELAGIRLVRMKPNGGFETIPTGEPTVKETAKDALMINVPIAAGGELTIDCTPNSMTFEATGVGAPKDWALELSWASSQKTAVKQVEPQAIKYQHNGFDYSLKCDCGSVQKRGESAIVITPSDTGVRFAF
ncbi:hypothetical protein CA13_03160 [Planctomycetes bacterium CA13]|uniref:Uncharacterized protein n=1 Tax=Novipirellula herctigrandis TaxID=2527986 RepID=A0A5C5YV44_9BACT|nr:hypothetical protein CA13_03160 [Planctomycetes bacterium CA13]